MRIRAVAAFVPFVLALSAVAAQAPAAVGTIVSIRSGAWNNPSTWNAARVPNSLDVVGIDHAVELNVDATVAAINIGRTGTLTFSPSASRTLTTQGNVVAEGVLRMRPSSGAVTHALTFTRVDERRFRGGGDSPLATDVGLWIRPEGVLDAAGTAKTPWTRATTTIPAGTTTLNVVSAAGWRAGDELALGPTRAEERGEAFEVMRIATVDAGTGRITLASPTARMHSIAALPDGRRLGPEVLNLTRNVRIEGTASGRSHVHIFSAPVQTIRYVALRHMGVPVRGNTGAGRYALHFHHNGDSSRGSLVEGVVARDVGTHAFVAHASHGITFRSTIAYDFNDAAYWWDRLEPNGRVSLTHDTLYEDCVAASGRGFGITHQFGLRNTMRGCVVYGIDLTRAGAPGKGFAWEEVPTNVAPFTADHAVWNWSDGIAHNVGNPLWVWQNDQAAHEVVRPTAYWPLSVGGRPSGGISHGAYVNVYRFTDGVVLGHVPFQLHAGSPAGDGGRRQEHRNMIYDAAGGDYGVEIGGHSLEGTAFGQIVGCRILNHARAAVMIDENSFSEFSRGADYTFRNCVTGAGVDLAPGDFEVRDLHPNSEICVQQRDDDAWMIDRLAAGVIVRRVSACP